MANNTDINNEWLRTLVGRVLADNAIGAIASQADLPSPIADLPGESEESTTWYFSLDRDVTTSRIIAVTHLLSPEKRSRLWAKIETARRSGSSEVAPLLPIASNKPEHEVFIYDDGKWIAKVFARLGLINEQGSIPKPDRILSGRAGFSRVYQFSLQMESPSPRRATYVIKFNRPDRAQNEWGAIKELRKGAQLPAIVLPLRDNEPEDGAIVYPWFAPYAVQVISFEDFLLHHSTDLPRTETALKLLGMALSQLYGKSAQSTSGEIWGARYKELQQGIAALKSAVNDLAYANSDASWHLSGALADVRVPNPFLALESRLKTDCGVTWEGQVHGDLQTSNILLGLAEGGVPESLGLIDVEKLRNNQPISDDLAGIEADFVRSVLPKLAATLLGGADHPDLDNSILKVLLLSLSELSGLKLEGISDIPQEIAFASKVVAHVIFRFRELARPFLKRYGFEEYDPTHYFHALLFHHLKALAWRDTQNHALRKQIVLIAAALAEKTIQASASGRDASNDSIHLPRAWSDIESSIAARRDPFARDGPESQAVRLATATDCYTISFLGGSGGMDQDCYRTLTVRGRPPNDHTELTRALDYLIGQTLQDRVGRLPSTSSFKQRSAEGEGVGSWPVVSLDDRIKETCGPEYTGPLRCLLLTDEPGGGKSTTARNVAWRIALRKHPFENEPRLPVYVRLRDWEISTYASQPFPAFLEQYHRGDPHDWPSRAFWARALGEGTRDGKLFLILDGLDELSSRKTFALSLLDQCATWGQNGNVVLMTCRTRSLGAYKSKLASFDILRVNGLNPEETARFVVNYPGSDRLDTKRLLHELREQSALRQLAPYPFLLDVICYLASNDHGTLPECRHQLIREALRQLLLEDLEHFDWLPNNKPTIQSLWSLIARTALILRLREPQDQNYNSFSFEVFESALQVALRNEPSANWPGVSANLTKFFSRTRFLQFPGEQDLSRDDIGSFSHGLFLDLLAAEGLRLIIEPSSGQSSWDNSVDYVQPAQTVRSIVAAKIFDSAWFELLCFLPALVQKDRREFFEILSHEPDDLLRRRATLALRALGELPTSVLETGQLHAWSEVVAQSCWEIAAAHWRLEIATIAEALVNEVPAIARVHPALVRRLAADLKSDNLQSRLDAISALDRIGAPAAGIEGVIAGLLHNLKHRNLAVRKLVSTTIAKLGTAVLVPIMQRLTDAVEWYELASACEAITRMDASDLGDQVSALLKRLIPLLDHRQPLVSGNACEALGSIAFLVSGNEQIASLTNKLIARTGPAEGDPAVRAQACTALARCIGGTPESPFPLCSLIAALADVDWVVRTSAITALADIARHVVANGPLALGEFSKLLQDTRAEVRAAVCTAIGKLHPLYVAFPDAVLPLVLQGLNDSSLVVTKCASEAASNLKITVVNPDLVSKLLGYLEDSDWQMRGAAVDALGFMSIGLAKEPEHILAHLFTNLKDSRWFVKACSCEVLGHLARAGVTTRQRILTELSGVLNAPDPEGYVAAKAIRALANCAVDLLEAVRVLPLIGAFLNSDKWVVQVAACEALYDMTLELDDGHEVVRELIGCMRSPVWCVRASACKALRRILRLPLTEANVLMALLSCVFDAQQPVRVAASEALTRLMGAGTVGLHLVVDDQSRSVIVSQGGKHFCDIGFPRPVPALLGLTLASPSLSKAAHARDWTVEPA
jgi:HEAT repeat protein